MTDKTAPAAASSKAETIDLAEPIIRGETSIEQLTIRKPKAGELRGLSIQELMNGRVTSTLDLLPRVTQPPISQAEADNMSTEDVASCAGAIIGFFLTSADKEKMKAMQTR
ncbi:MAG TPA: phage tail assembly protein [Sphingopyxis sp.]|nr:phage tail assembly protein [Sphingopyxis sp.]